MTEAHCGISQRLTDLHPSTFSAASDDIDLASLEQWLTSPESMAVRGMRNNRRRVESLAAWLLAKQVYLIAGATAGTPQVKVRLIGQCEEWISSYPKEQLDRLSVVKLQAGGRAPSIWDRRRGKLHHGVSVAHKYPLVAAGVVPDGCSVGVDLERVRLFDSSFVNFFFHDDVRLPHGPSFDPAFYYTALWTLKEACLKALRCDQTELALRDVSVVWVDLRKIQDSLDSPVSVPITFRAKQQTRHGQVILGSCDDRDYLWCCLRLTSRGLGGLAGMTTD